MIITCINCDKKFNVDSDLIPNEGRSIQCGSCNHMWFYVKNNQIKPTIKKDISPPDEIISAPKKAVNKAPSRSIEEINAFVNKNNKINDNIAVSTMDYNSKAKFTLVGFLSYILVVIISFIAVIIILDTFKKPFYNFFPNLEFFLFNFFETLKDIKLFIKDLI